MKQWYKNRKKDHFYLKAKKNDVISRAYYKIEEIDKRSFSTFFKDPEKLFHVAFSLSIFSTVALDKQVKLPNFIDCPVNDRVKNL